MSQGQRRAGAQASARSASRSSASATAPAASSRAATTTRTPSPTDFVPGLMHVQLGDYHISDVEFVAAFDVDKEKVGKDLSEAIFSGQNNTYKFMDVPHMGVKVDRGMTHDGIGKYLSPGHREGPRPHGRRRRDPEGARGRRHGLLPARSGSEEATKWYVEQALKAGVGFVNAIPVFIGREPYWQRRFAEEGLPVIGDDIKSQVGATITHRVLTRLFMDRGVRIDRTYQLNFGGNTDFLNMLERERLESKKISQDQRRHLDDRLRDRRRATSTSARRTTCRGSRTASGATSGSRARPSVTSRSTPSSSSRSGTAPTAPASSSTRSAACGSASIAASRARSSRRPSYFMKSPPLQIHDDVAHQRVEAFIRGEDNETLVGNEESQKDSKALAAAAGKCGPPPSGDPAAQARGAPPAPRVHAATHRRTGGDRRLPVDGRRPRVRAAGALAGRHRHGRRRSSYLAWPAKRRFSNANFGHVLGLAARAPARPAPRAPGVPRVRALHGRAHAPPVPPARGAGRRASRATGIDRGRAGVARVGRAMIVVAGHMGNNEAVAAALADRGYPVNVIADDSVVPRAVRAPAPRSASRGASTLIPWRNLRELFSVLRRKEILAPARRLGLPARRRSRSRLFDAWTTLPAGPATLAAKTGAIDRPARHPAHAARPVPDRGATRRSPSPRPTRRTSSAPPSGSPTASRRPSAPRRSSGTASSRCGPTTRPRPAELEAQAAAMLAGRPRSAAVEAAARLGRHRPRGRADVRRAAAGPAAARAAASAAARLASPRCPRAARRRRRESVGELWYRIAPAGRAQARANLRRVCEGLAATAAGTRRARRAATDPEALERLVRRCFRHAARYYLEVARAGVPTTSTTRSRGSTSRRGEVVRDGAPAGGRSIIVGMHFGAIELPVVFLADRRRPRA